jgi:hypothetical protein
LARCRILVCRELQADLYQVLPFKLIRYLHQKPTSPKEASVSSSYVRGAAEDAKLKERLERRTRGIPVVIPFAAAGHCTDGARRDKARPDQSALFSAEMDQQGARYKPFSLATSMNGSVQKCPRVPRLFSSAATASVPSESPRRWRKNQSTANQVAFWYAPWASSAGLGGLNC